MNDKPTILDLFSGGGMFSYGLERAGMETVAFCEIEEYPRKVLAKHWPNIPIYDDVRTLTKERLDSDGIGSIDVICGGFPCQDASTARTNNDVNGSRKGINGEKTGLWKEFKRIISEFRPGFAVMENVSALLSGESGEWFGDILRDLAEIGYDAVWHCIPASNIGAPHERDRVWIIAYPNEAQREGGCISERIYQEYANARRNSWWEDKPGVHRVDDGIPSQMDRLALIGNAVVPQIPEIIGQAIMSLIPV